jgi:cytochrome c-type biogenesis protein CcmH
MPALVVIPCTIKIGDQMMTEIRLPAVLLLLVALLPSYHGALAESATPTIQVSVSLSETLQAQARPDDTLFVYARAPAGPRMPLAIVRLTAADLPATVTLDDSSAMMPNMKLSVFDEVVVMARISRSGDAMTRSGDLLGSSAPLRVRESPQVRVRIEEQVP